MLEQLLRTDDNYVALVLRVILAIVIFPHGAQKLLGWFGGHGRAATLGYFKSIGIPTVVGWLVIAVEFFGSIALFLGVLGRLAAFSIACVMVGAVLMVHRPHGFFMNWSGDMKGEGYEYHLLALAIAAGVIMMGSGAMSVDLMLIRDP